MNNLLIPLVLTVLGVIIMTLFVLPHVYRETKIKDDIKNAY
jgi:hypothetical protein